MLKWFEHRSLCFSRRIVHLCTAGWMRLCPSCAYGAELWQDFRLSRRAMNSLQRLLDRGQDHGWGNDLEVLIYTYWLAHGLSYRVVSSVFSVPKTTVHSHTPGGTEHLEQFEQGDLLPTGQGAASSSRRVCKSLRDPCICKCRRGAIDGSHIRIKPP